jgi:hypothetical protein
MAGRWTPNHQALIEDAACDVWLVTEVKQGAELDGYERHLSDSEMRSSVQWAGIFSRHPLAALPDPHEASAAADIGGTVFCSSILPWRGSGGVPPWSGDTHAERTRAALGQLRPLLSAPRLVWGGDWNHALSGMEEGGSKGGRAHILEVVNALGLDVPTAELPHWIDGHLTIDHIAVKSAGAVKTSERIVAKGLSDHDCYVVELEPAA